MNEKRKILIGYDGSDCSEAALDDLLKAGLPQSDVEALVLVVLQELFSSAKVLQVHFATRQSETAKLQTSHAPSHHFHLTF